MKSGLDFLLAARECEIAELERLAHASELVTVIGRFVHALQRERGMSNIYLASGGSRSARQRTQQVALTQAEHQNTLAHLDSLQTDAVQAPNGARLFSRVAVALHGLEALPDLRAGVGSLTVTAAESIAAYSRHIAHLLAVVFEAADSAGHPDVSRALVAMFNFMQGKEFAGQERACGGAVFASGQAEPMARRHWMQLIELQEGCFQLFRDFADGALLDADHQIQDPLVQADIERLRRIALSALPTEDLDTSLTDTWYEQCTRRLDAMRSVEDTLALNLRRVCARQVASARAQLRDPRAALAELVHEHDETPAKLESRYGPNLERSIVAMVQAQTRRLQAVSNELDTVKQSLNERKLVERAKGLLMAHRQLSEEEAHKVMRTMAMNQNRRLVEVAEAILTMADVLPARTESPPDRTGTVRSVAGISGMKAA
jgi:prefoldin subunit 5